MKHDLQTLPDSTVELKAIISSLGDTLSQLEEENRLLRQALFAPKSEKQPPAHSAQLCLFDMPEPLPAADAGDGEEIVIPSHTRPKKGRRQLPADLPRLEIVHDIAEEEKLCACGCRLSRIGEDVSEKLDIVPAKVRVIRHIRPKYACKNCEGVADEEGAVKIAPPPAQIIPKGLATAGLLAAVLTAKFCDALPFYRQEKQFLRLGIDIGRQTMCNWAMKAAGASRAVLDLLHAGIRSGPLINVDETPVQVLQEPGRSPTQKSYMWVFRGGTPENPVIMYQYHQTRSGDVVKMFLDGYAGIVQTDGYKAYDFLDNRHDIVHVGCWAHARRKFMDVKKAGAKNKTGSADKALHMIQRLYSLERLARSQDMAPASIREMRQRQAKPILAQFKQWLDKRRNQVAPKSLLGVAIHYCLGQWRRLTNYIDDGHAGIDNNVVENAIRPFALGRKNWLFAGTPTGARASALLFSLIETAKANKLEPYRYLRYLFEKLPVTPDTEVDRLLPNRLKSADLILPDAPSGV